MAAPGEEEPPEGEEEWRHLRLDAFSRRLVFTYLTFPGVVVHEFAHYFGVKLAGLRVVRVGWFLPRRWPLVGFVLHTLPRPGAGGFNLLFAALLPALLPNLLGAWLLMETARFMGSSGIPTDPLSILLALWIGASSIYHGVPSPMDFRVAGMGLASLRQELRRAQAQHKLLRLVEYGTASALYGVLWLQQVLFGSFYGHLAWAALFAWAALSIAPGTL